MPVWDLSKKGKELLGLWDLSFLAVIPVHMRASSQMEDEVNLPDIGRLSLTDRGPQIHVNELKSGPGPWLLVFQHVGNSVEVSREVQTVKADDVP